MPCRIAALTGLLILMPLARADNWPQWRGPKNDGVSKETGIPAEWGPDKNVIWKFPLPGPGASTPCIWGDAIFLTCMDETEVSLLRIGTDGKQKWKKTLGQGNIRTMRDEGGNLASGSCSTDGSLVFVLVGSGKLAAFDFEGNERWSKDFAKEYGDYTKGNVIQFGGHWTPVLYKGRLYVTILHRLVQKVISLDAASGEQKWAVDRVSDAPKGVESPDVYASPFIWEKGDQAQLLVHGNDYCTAHNLSDGRELWRVTELNPKGPRYNRAWRAVSSPLATPDLVVVPSCKRGVTVGIDPLKAKGPVGPKDEGEVWRIERNTPDVPSPLLVGNVLYLMGEQGSLMVHDAKSGKLLYEERITNQRHRANPVFVDGKVILTGRDGVMVVVKHGEKFEKLAENKLPDTFLASPAISGGRLYLRGWKDLYAIGSK
jgi:outer membrane protein assembly factor BamB